MNSSKGASMKRLSRDRSESYSERGRAVALHTHANSAIRGITRWVKIRFSCGSTTGRKLYRMDS